MIPIPPKKPEIALKEIQKLMKRKGYDEIVAPTTPYCVAIRGYYLDTMGVKGKNDLNMFDDMVAWVWPSGIATFNFNTDPTRFGYNKNAGKNMAQLVPGIYRFVKRKHKNQYAAFGQGGNMVAVYRRDSSGKITTVEEGLFGINIHKAGATTTSSEGCLTVPISQWDQFKTLGYSLLERNSTQGFPFVLFDEETERKIAKL
jgi:lysozyme